MRSCRPTVAAALTAVVLAGCGRLGFDAEVDAGVGPDGDDDGVADGLDNCPARNNPDQHDEDSDGVGDACDLCPHLASTSTPQPDGDGDGVGDACDPSELVANRIAGFWTFAAPPVGAVMAPAGAWTIANDEALVTLGPAEVGSITLTTVATTHSVTTGVRVDAVAGAGGNPARNIAIIDGYDTAPDSGFFAGIVYDAASGPPAEAFLLDVLNGNGNVTFASAPVESTFSLGFAYQLRYDRDGDTRRLRAETASGNIDINASYVGMSGVVGIRSRGVTARYQYVLIIE